MGRSGKRAVTHVELLRVLAGGLASLVRCRLETGRSHQIRVHLAEQGKTPILADALYGSKPSDPRLAAVAAALGRQALHATELGFAHPEDGQPMHFVSELPCDMQTALDALSCASE